MKFPWLNSERFLLVGVRHEGEPRNFFILERKKKSGLQESWQIVSKDSELTQIYEMLHLEYVNLVLFDFGVIGKSVESNFTLTESHMSNLIPEVKFKDFIWQCGKDENDTISVTFCRSELVTDLLSNLNSNRVWVKDVALFSAKDFDLNNLTQIYDRVSRETKYYDVKELDLVFENYQYAGKIRKWIVFGSILILLLLGINFVANFYIQEKFDLIHYEEEMKLAISDSIAALENDVNEKKRLFGGQTLNSIYASRYLDQLASFQPKGINFNQVNVFPAVIANSDDADLVRISDGKIVISGQVSESILLQQYVALLKGMNWIKQVRISSYERNQENEGNNFGLIIHVK